jgi:two-component system sensor histidine kinase TctE
MRECDRQAGAPSDMAALRDIVRSIAATTDSTVLLANRLLTLARIEHGGENLAMDTVLLRDVAQQVGLEMAMAAVGRHIDLSLEAPDEAPVHGQALLLHELVANLVDNALRYTPPGGSVILRVRADGAGNETVLEVEDSGAGIPPAERERVLTPFYRVGAALESNPGGAGLGLAIVRDIAALHGARLELATAANGHGLKVGVYFSGVA